MSRMPSLYLSMDARNQDLEDKGLAVSLPCVIGSELRMIVVLPIALQDAKVGDQVRVRVLTAEKFAIAGADIREGDVLTSLDGERLVSIREALAGAARP